MYLREIWYLEFLMKLIPFRFQLQSGKNKRCLRESLHTGCPRRNEQNFGREFLMLKCTDITQNTYVQSWTVTEIKAREKCGLFAFPHTVPGLRDTHTLRIVRPCLQLAQVRSSLWLHM